MRGSDQGKRLLLVSYVKGGVPRTVNVEVLETGESEESQRLEATQFVQTLVDNGDLDGPTATHEIITGPDGGKLLRRRGFR